MAYSGWNDTEKKLSNLNIEMAYGNPYAPVITQIQLPFSNPIAGGLTEGKQIQIQGVVQEHPQADRFSINLCYGPKLEPDTALHFNPRFDEGCIVRNAMIGGGWGPEERDGGLPIVKGQVFEIIIMATSNAYQIAVNGQHFASFKHRMPMAKAQYLNIGGSYMKINFVKFEGGMNAPPRPAPMGMAPNYTGPPAYGFNPAPAPPPYTPGGFVAPPAAANYNPPGTTQAPDGCIFNPSIPLTQRVPGGLVPNKLINIDGIVSPEAKRFTVNLMTGRADIGFHFDVRLDHMGERNVVVRNTLKNNEWGQEERKIPHFPFQRNVNFTMLILTTPDSFKVAVNNSHFIEYKHRLPLKDTHTLNITGDIRIHSVRFQ